jgi:hypothetical protein
VAIVIDQRFLVGVLVGVGGVWAWHRFVRPMASKANG